MRPAGVQMRGETIAIAAVLLILVAFPAAVVLYQFVVRPALGDVRTIDIIARIPESGGFTPETIRIAAGETVRLRFSVPDVTHGIAIGPGLGLDLGHVDPGQVKEMRVTFDRPGRYTLYCNAWCSPSHWRMRGTIVVYDPAHPDAMLPSDPSDPVIESLAARRVNVDAPHDALAVPTVPVSVERGAHIVARLGRDLPADVATPAWRRGHSPAEAWMRLVATGLAADEAWDVVASLWVREVDQEKAAVAATLFAKNCAACHGESGDGRGPGAEALAALGIGRHGGFAEPTRPAGFGSARSMLEGTSGLYYAKVRRGGMGTGMPSWGPTFTPDEVVCGTASPGCLPAHVLLSGLPELGLPLFRPLFAAARVGSVSTAQGRHCVVGKSRHDDPTTSGHRHRFRLRMGRRDPTGACVPADAPAYGQDRPTDLPSFPILAKHDRSTERGTAIAVSLRGSV